MFVLVGGQTMLTDIWKVVKKLHSIFFKKSKKTRKQSTFLTQSHIYSSRYKFNKFLVHLPLNTIRLRCHNSGTGNNRDNFSSYPRTFCNSCPPSPLYNQFPKCWNHCRTFAVHIRLSKISFRSVSWPSWWTDWSIRSSGLKGRRTIIPQHKRQDSSVKLTRMQPNRVGVRPAQR
jgi:hypothetical protein